MQRHVDAFEEIGGIPARHVKYDNLAAAVKSVFYGRGRDRVENARWVLFRSHHGFGSCYCQPELGEAADEKLLARTIARYGRVGLLCINELGGWNGFLGSGGTANATTQRDIAGRT